MGYEPINVGSKIFENFLTRIRAPTPRPRSEMQVKSDVMSDVSECPSVHSLIISLPYLIHFMSVLLTRVREIWQNLRNIEIMNCAFESETLKSDFETLECDFETFD